MKEYYFILYFIEKIRFCLKIDTLEAQSNWATAFLSEWKNSGTFPEDIYPIIIKECEFYDDSLGDINPRMTGDEAIKWLRGRMYNGLIAWEKYEAKIDLKIVN